MLLRPSAGVPRSEIKKFADTQHWLDFFPPIAKVRAGVAVLMNM